MVTDGRWTLDIDIRAMYDARDEKKHLRRGRYREVRSMIMFSTPALAHELSHPICGRVDRHIVECVCHQRRIANTTG